MLEHFCCNFWNFLFVNWDRFVGVFTVLLLPALWNLHWDFDHLFGARFGNVFSPLCQISNETRGLFFHGFLYGDFSLNPKHNKCYSQHNLHFGC